MNILTSSISHCLKNHSGQSLSKDENKRESYLSSISVELEKILTTYVDPIQNYSTSSKKKKILKTIRQPAMALNCNKTPKRFKIIALAWL